MSMTLERVRECDGACCRESPRFPNADHSDCIYHDGEDKTKGCALQRDPSMKIDGESPIWPGRSAREVFRETCIEWPQNSTPGIGETANCCWQWVERWQ